MQFTVLCEGEPIGHADFAVVRGSSTTGLIALPAFEQFRPTIDRHGRALLEGARRVARARTPDHTTTPEVREGTMIVRRIDAELGQRIDLQALKTEMEPARRLRFELRDSSDAAVTTWHLFVWTTAPGSGAAWVTASIKH